MSKFIHSPMHIKQPATFGRIATLQAKNISNRVVKSGESVIFDIEYDNTPGTEICFNVTASAVAQIRSRVLGTIEGTDISPGASGPLRIWGRHTGVWVTGTTISKGDWIALSTVHPGVSELLTVESKCGFAIAGNFPDTAGGTSPRKKIEATLVLWRV